MDKKNLKKIKQQNSECNLKYWKQLHESINF